MRWYHAAIIALGLVAGGALSGGVYALSREGGEVVRFNRFTGAVDIYYIPEDKEPGDRPIGWYRFPNAVKPLLESPQ